MTAGPRIGVFTTSYPRFEGDLAGHFVENAAGLLMGAGYQVSVSSPHAPGAPRRECKDGVSIQRFRYAVPESMERVAYGSGILANLRRDGRAWLALPGFLAALMVAAYRLKKHSDLVHAHWIPCGLAAIVASGRRGPPVVVTIRGSDMPLARESRLVRRTLGRAAAVVAVSEAMRSELVGLGLDPVLVSVIREAIDLGAPPAGDRLTARRRLGLEERTTILFLGRLSHVKGPDVLLRAVSGGLLEQTDAQLVFLGGGNMEESLREAARALPPGRVRFEGFVPHGRVGEWIAASDLLVMPSRSEGLPLALVEALSFGLPVVASRVGGIPEIVSAGETGWLVPPEDAEALERALREALSDRGTLDRMGRNGRQLVAEGRFDGRRLCDDLTRLYSEVLSPCKALSTAPDATSSQSKR